MTGVQTCALPISFSPVILNALSASSLILLAIKGGNADFALEDYPVIAYKIKLDADNDLRITGEKVTTSNYGFAVNKGKNAELLEKFQSGLKAIKENGKYDEILSKYLN